MGDPLSIAASIVAVIQMTGTVLQYVIDAKGASDDRQKILCEIASTQSFLVLLKNKADEPQWDNTLFETMKALNAPRGP